MQNKINELAGTAIQAVSAACAEYNIEIEGDRMAKIMNAEVIAPPMLELRKERGNGQYKSVPVTSRGETGGNFDLRGCEFYKPMTLNNWRIVTVGRSKVDERNADKTVRTLISEGKKLGMNIEYAAGLDHKDLGTIEAYIEECSRSDVELLMIVLPRKSSNDYSWVKKVAELQYGVMTQCILDKTFLGNPTKGGFSSMTAVNLLLKINTKLDGVNCRLDKVSKIQLFEKPVMIIAASLSHSMGTGPTVAALSASIDSSGSQYISFASLQKKTHLIEGIKDLASKALAGFYKGKGFLIFTI